MKNNKGVELNRERILKQLELNGWTQKELAKKMGVSEVTVSHWLNKGDYDKDGIRKPSKDNFLKLAKILGVLPQYILAPSTKKNPDQSEAIALFENVIKDYPGAVSVLSDAGYKYLGFTLSDRAIKALGEELGLDTVPDNQEELLSCLSNKMDFAKDYSMRFRAPAGIDFIDSGIAFDFESPSGSTISISENNFTHIAKTVTNTAGAIFNSLYEPI